MKALQLGMTSVAPSIMFRPPITDNARMMLEDAASTVVPCQGEPYRRVKAVETLEDLVIARLAEL